MLSVLVPFLLASFQRPLVPLLQFSNQEWFGWGGEEGHGEDDTDDGVEVDAGPDEEGGREGEQHEGGHGEGEGGLSRQETEEVIVQFVGGGAEAVGGEEEGADVSADVWSET